MVWVPKDLAPLNQTFKAANQERWDQHKVLPQWLPLAAHVADKIIANKPRYDQIEKITKVPWDVVGMIHDRESSLSWLGYLGNGDPWDKKTIHEPSLRGPFTSWENGAYDALCKCPPFAAKWSDWSLGGKLTLLELYNGLGYARMGHASPYLWSGTDQYVKGKYIADHHYDPDAVDHQLGCAIVLSQIYERMEHETSQRGRSEVVTNETPDRTVHSPGDESTPPIGSLVHPGTGV